MQDIRANVTGAADQWKPYDEKYVLDRILRAIREAKGAAAILLFLIPLAGHAQTYKGEAIHKIIIAYCIGNTLHAPPCATDDVAFVDNQTRVHFSKPIPEAEMCTILHRLGYQ